MNQTNKMSPEQIIQYIKFVKEDIKETDEAMKELEYGKLILFK